MKLSSGHPPTPEPRGPVPSLGILLPSSHSMTSCTLLISLPLTLFFLFYLQSFSTFSTSSFILIQFLCVPLWMPSFFISQQNTKYPILVCKVKFHLTLEGFTSWFKCKSCLFNRKSELHFLLFLSQQSLAHCKIQKYQSEGGLGNSMLSFNKEGKLRSHKRKAISLGSLVY